MKNVPEGGKKKISECVFFGVCMYVYVNESLHVCTMHACMYVCLFVYTYYSSLYSFSSYSCTWYIFFLITYSESVVFPPLLLPNFRSSSILHAHTEKWSATTQIRAFTNTKLKKQSCSSRLTKLWKTEIWMKNQIKLSCVHNNIHLK